MIEIGAGGGSIARIDEMGLLKVGPDSAGSVPGPACYGRGGVLPTVTDANLVLGFLDADSFLGGAMKLDLARAKAALEPLARRLGVDVERAAQGILDVVNTNMIAAAKMHVAERGGDPRRYAMVAFGGMGPMHAHAVARGLKVDQIICPASAGVLSAWGMLVAPTAFDFARSLVGVLDDGIIARARGLFEQLAAEGRRLLVEAGAPPQDIRFRYGADMRYAGQIREIEVVLPPDLDDLNAETVRRLFMAQYEQAFGHVHDDVPVHFMTGRLTASTPTRALPNRTKVVAAAETLKGRRRIVFDTDRNGVEAQVHDRYRLQPGSRLRGPAVIEENESTVVVPPGAVVQVDDALNVIVNLSGRL
jgi:N-methylhydantoinase A/oxoprolinase/acetone carboxylase beta subunit